jgi:hypothetical protein
VNPGKPLILPGLAAGPHEFKGVRNGYQPDTKEIVIAPGQDATVSLRIRYARVIKKSAIDLNERGERLLHTQRSTINPLNVVQINRSQSEADLREARDLFSKALADDTGYAKAALNLAQTYQLLDEQEKSSPHTVRRWRSTRVTSKPISDSDVSCSKPATPMRRCAN